MSVCQSDKRVDCDKTKNICARILIPHERSIHPSFPTRRMVGGGPVLPEILGLTDPVVAKTPIFDMYVCIYVFIYLHQATWPISQRNYKKRQTEKNSAKVTVQLA